MSQISDPISVPPLKLSGLEPVTIGAESSTDDGTAPISQSVAISWGQS